MEKGEKSASVGAKSVNKALPLEKISGNKVLPLNENLCKEYGSSFGYSRLTHWRWLLLLDTVQAEQLAQHFFASRLRTRGVVTPRLLYAMEAGATAHRQSELGSVYVYGAGHGSGFVVIAGNDTLPEVLGYADRGQLDAERIPPALIALFKSYAEAAGQAKRTRGEKIVPVDLIAPILQRGGNPIQWGQGTPYNLETPSRFPTGCVATAVAQIMFFS